MQTVQATQAIPQINKPFSDYMRTNLDSFMMGLGHQFSTIQPTANAQK